MDIPSLQTLARRTDIAELTAGYGLVVADKCHHVPAAAFENAVRRIPPRRQLGLTATPYRRDKLDDPIAWQVAETRHTSSPPREHDQDAAATALGHRAARAPNTLEMADEPNWAICAGRRC
jgi:superfamily II DNA or RNA helicase